MIYLAIFFIIVPVILIFFDNLTRKKYQMTIEVESQIQDEIERIFKKNMLALENQDFDELKKIYDTNFFNKYCKRMEKNKIRDNKEYLKDCRLEGITNFKYTREGFKVDLSYRAISYSAFDPNRLEIYWRLIDYWIKPLSNGTRGDKENYTLYKQCWWFKQTKNKLKISKIKNYYIKTTKSLKDF